MFDFLLRPIRRNFGIDKEYYRFIDDMFGFIPNNIELYKLALIHKSASQSIGGLSMNNERLEFLGDAVIECVTSDYLYIEFPDRNEGFLTQLRSKIVSRQSLNDMAHEIGLDKYVITGSNGGGLVQKHIYGDAFEAMVGAIYLDQGYEFVNRLLINNIFYKYLNLEYLTESETDFKSRLIEWCQKNHHNVVFRTRTVTDSRASAPVFNSTVLIDGMAVGYGSGDSKKTAEQSAACSVTREIGEEEYTELLDKLDRMEAESARRKQQKGTVKAADAGKSDNNISAETKNRGNNSPAVKRQPDKQPQAQPVADAVPAKSEEIGLVAAEAEVLVVAESDNSSAEMVVNEPSETRRRRRRPSRAQKRDGQTENADAQNMMEPANAGSVGFDVDTAAAETAAEPAPERKPSRRRPSRAKKANAESAVAADKTAADASAKPGDGDAVSAEEAAPGLPAPTKRRRRSSSRTKKEAPNSEQQAETQVENI